MIVEKVIVEETYVTIALSKYDAIIKKYSRRYGFDWVLISAQVFAESSFRPKIVSYCGAVGLMQIMPGTSRWLGVNPDLLMDPETNISLGCYYDSKIYASINGAATNYDHLSFMFASYNCGPARVKKIRQKVEDGQWEDINSIVPKETQQYVPKIWTRYREYKLGCHGKV